MRSRAHFRTHPIHPMLVAFPIGLWVTSLIFDLVGAASGDARYWTAGYFMAGAGVVFAVLAAIPGVIDLLSVVPPKSSARRRGFLHGGLNSLALLIFAYVTARRGGPTEQPGSTELLLSALGVGLVLISGWLGGTLVYRNQIGVDHRYANAGKWRERELSGWDRPVCNQSELSNGQMMLARVGRDRVVLGRCEEGVFAFSDHCTHRGGPLSDGALIGCTVQCPWHGSQFDIRTGRVVAGPAHHQIDCWPIEVRAGEVYVRIREGEQARETESKGTQDDHKDDRGNPDERRIA